MPVHGRIDLTKEAVDALYQNTVTKFHLIIMDDSDASIREGAFHQVEPWDVTAAYFEKFCKHKDNVTYINNPKPFRNGNEFFNLGFKYCKYDYVATIMNSVKVEPAWDRVALHLMKEDPKIGIIGFKNLFPSGLIETAGIVFQGHVPTDFGRDEPGCRLNDNIEMRAVQWAFALIRLNAVFDRATQKSILDDTLFEGFVGWDDIDNCLEVASRGWKIMYCGMGAGTHLPRATRGDNRVEAQRKNKKNAETFFKRWGFMDSYRSLNRMNIGDKLSDPIRTGLIQGVLQLQAIQNMEVTLQTHLQGLVNKAMEEAKVGPDMYNLSVDPMERTFMLSMKQNPQPATVVATPVASAPPAGDTKVDEPALAGGEVKV